MLLVREIHVSNLPDTGWQEEMKNQELCQHLTFLNTITI